jgi:hypothetical protein
MLRDSVNPAPLYIVMISHFESGNLRREDIEALCILSQQHPNMKWTHLFNPVVYTKATPLLSEIEAYLLEARDKLSAEIGVHIHMWRTLMEHAGVNFRSAPSMLSNQPSSCKLEPHDDGYSVPMNYYSRQELKSILEFTIDKFAQHNLGRPITFCPGGYATSPILQSVLEELKFTTSASACPAGAHTLGQDFGPCWDLLAGWGTAVQHTTRPYRVSRSTILPGGPEPYLDLIEIPQTCKIDCLISSDDMIEIFKWHLDIALRGQPTVVCFALHELLAAWQCRQDKFHRVLTFVDESSTKLAGNVPVIYKTASEVSKIFAELLRGSALKPQLSK